VTRLPRYVIPGQPQHIIQRGNNRQVIFAADTDYLFFRDAVVETASKYGLAIHAYVWISNSQCVAKIGAAGSDGQGRSGKFVTESTR